MSLIFLFAFILCILVFTSIIFLTKSRENVVSQGLCHLSNFLNGTWHGIYLLSYMQVLIILYAKKSSMWRSFFTFLLLLYIYIYIFAFDVYGNSIVKKCINIFLTFWTQKRCFMLKSFCYWKIFFDKFVEIHIKQEL